MLSQKKFFRLKKSYPIRRYLLENKILEEENLDTQQSSLTVPKEMRFMKRKRKEKREKKVDRLSQKSKKMKKVFAQDKKVAKVKMQGKKVNEKTDRTLRSSKKNVEQSSSVSDTFCIICLEPYSESAPGEIWRRCIIRKSWAHKCCVTSSIRFKCPSCQQLDQ